MDFSSPRRPASTSSSGGNSKGRFPLPFSLSMSKSSSSSAKTTATVTAKQQQHAFAPGIAKRQSHSEWMGGRKSLGEYARLPKLSPTNDNIIITPPGNSSGRLSSQMSAGSSRSSTSASGDLHGNNGSGSGNNGVLFDDSIAAEEGRENFARNGGNDSGRRNKFTLDDGFLQGEAAGASSVPFPGLVKPLTKSPDILSVESARVAQRLASASSPSSSNPSVRTANLISFKEEQPADLLLVDTGDRDSTQGKHNGGGGSVVANVWDRPNTLIAPTATPLANKSNGFADAKNVRPRTSLETIRQQIRQIESEIRVSNGTRQQQQQQHALSSRHDNFGDGFLGLSRPIQPSFSSQSIPANFDSCDYESSSLSPHGNRHHNYHHQRSGSHNKFLPHMQRAYSVDVAVHSAISDIQSAVRRNSMIRLKSSTNALQQAGIEEEEDNVWVKRDSSAQTEMQEVADESPQHLVVPAPVPALLSPVTPETDEEMENESRQLLSHENGGEDGIGGGGGGVSGINCDNRIGSLSRPLSARRPSCQSAHDLIEGVLFRCCYLGSTHLFSDSRPTKSSRLNQAQEAVTRIKAPDGESQPMTDVDLFISMEKIMVLNVDIQDILMDHPLRTISYIADIGDLVVLMVKRGLEDLNCDAVLRSTQPKMLCHVFQSDEASMIAQTIGNAFQVAYMEYLKANGIQDDRYLRHLDYLEVLNSQEMSTNELDLFASKDKQMNVVIPKQKGEILGVVIVESGWGSMLPTVIIANLCPGGPGARCGKLSIGDQLISINGISLVGLPLAQCQTTIKNVKTHTVVKLTIVSCPPVVEVKIKRPDTRYQLGFSVQNGIICSLLRGGIAERGGIRVGHRIIEINNQSVVATNHENIVNMLAHSVGEIELKTMPSSIFRLLTGQDTPVYI